MPQGRNIVGAGTEYYFSSFLMMGWDSGMSSRASNSYKSFLLMTK